MNFPALNRLYLNFPDGYLGKQIWKNDKYLTRLKKGIETDRFALMPTLQDDILYIDTIKAVFERSLEYLSGDKNYIESSILTITSDNKIEILLDSIAIDADVDTNLKTQEIYYVSERTPFFKIKDLSRKQTFDVVIRIVSENSRRGHSISHIYYRFYYNLFTKMGDVNGDGKIDLFDVVSFSNHVQGISSVPYPIAGDMNGDGKYTIDDVINLSNYVINNG